MQLTSLLRLEPSQPNKTSISNMRPVPSRPGDGKGVLFGLWQVFGSFALFAAEWSLFLMLGCSLAGSVCQWCVRACACFRVSRQSVLGGGFIVCLPEVRRDAWIFPLWVLAIPCGSLFCVGDNLAGCRTAFHTPRPGFPVLPRLTRDSPGDQAGGGKHERLRWDARGRRRRSARAQPEWASGRRCQPAAEPSPIRSEHRETGQRGALGEDYGRAGASAGHRMCDDVLEHGGAEGGSFVWRVECWVVAGFSPRSMVPDAAMPDSVVLC